MNNCWHNPFVTLIMDELPQSNLDVLEINACLWDLSATFSVEL